MNKPLVIFSIILLFFSSFTLFSGQANASPPSSGDIAFANTTVSYTDYETHQYTSSTQTVTVTGSAVSYSENISFSAPTTNISNKYGTYVAYYNLTGLSLSVTSGSTLSISIWGVDGETYHDYKDYAELAYVNATFFIGGSGQLVASYYYGVSYTVSSDNFELSGSATSSYSGTLTEISIRECAPADGDVGWSGANAGAVYSETGIGTGSTTTTFSHSVPITIISNEYNFNGASASSSFSSLMYSNMTSFQIDWSAQYATTAVYDSNDYTSSPITGISGVYSITFDAGIGLVSFSSYTVSYYVVQNTASSTPETYTYPTATDSYSISLLQSHVGEFWNSSTISFSFALPSSASTSYSASYKILISNLTIALPSSTYISFVLSSQNFTYYSLVKYKNTYNITAYKNFTTAQSATVAFTTSELINDNPSYSYLSLHYSGHGSTEILEVNATNPFNNESLQISNLNWGDGSPTSSSSVEYPAGTYYNFSFSHQYGTTGTYTVTFLIVNAVSASSSLSVSESTSITLTLTISTTSNALPVKTDSYIYFNYTQLNLNLQNVFLYVNNILALAQNVSSNTNYAGSVQYQVPYYLTQTATFTAEWEYSGGGISGNVIMQYAIANSVPSVGKWVILNYTIGTGLTATRESVPYFYSQVISYNVSWSYFVWQISLPGNAVNISVKGSTLWKSPIISVPADFNASTATFRLLENISNFQVVWLAPNPVGNALVVIQYYPESAVFGQFGINIPFGEFETFLNGKQIYSPVQQVSLGESITVNTTTTYGVLISSYKTTVTVETQFLEIPLPIVPLTVENLNSSYVIGMQVSQNGIVQTAPYLMPLQTQTFYIPSGTYNFSFSYLNFNSYSVVKYFNTSMTVTGVSYFIISGVTLTNINAHISQTQNNITNLVENVNINLINGNSKVYNETLRINASISNTNSSVIREILDENGTINNIYSRVQSIDAAVYAIQNNILSDINQTSLNITTRTTVIKNLVSLSLQEENSTFSYTLKFGTPSISGETYSFPVFVSLFNGQMANMSVTQQAWQNLRLYYISGNETVSLPFSVSDVKPGSFIVSIQNITPSMAQQISSNDAVISAQGEVKEGALVNLAAGIIGSSQITYSSSNLWTEIFGVSPPRLNDSVSGMLHILSWLDESYAGRAIYLIVILAALAYYTIMIQNSFDRRKKK